MALVSKLATKAIKKPAFKNVRSMVEAKAAARKEASTFKTIDQLKKEAIAAKPSTKKAEAPSSSEAARRQKADTRLLAATGSMFTAGAAYENAKQKKGAPTAEAKGRRGGRTGSAYTASPAESKVSVRSVKPAAAAPKTKDGNTTADAPKAAAPTTEKKMLGGREVKNGKVFVSKAELDAFQKKYGTDKTLTDLLNAERGLTRRDAPAKKAKASVTPLKTLETQADVEKRRAKQKALKEKARRETT
jgi:hypothetical protein